jgi:hypothetical protein
MKPTCSRCGETFSAARRNAGYHLCLFCGDDAAREERKGWCIAPMHKSNYMLFTNPADLIGINNKGGLVK